MVAHLQLPMAGEYATRQRRATSRNKQITIIRKSGVLKSLGFIVSLHTATTQPNASF